jgi:hypothetical protein
VNGGGPLSEISISIFVCLTVFVWLILLLRSDRISLGLPVAYLSLLLVSHLPGALVHVVGEGFLAETGDVEIGTRLTAIGSVCFVGGVWLARFGNANILVQRAADRHRFWLFCLIGGSIFTYGLGFLRSIPSLGAIVENGGGIWFLGVMFGLQAALYRGDHKWTVFWLAALVVYPVTGLLFSGFLSYATRAAIIVFCGLIITIRSPWRVIMGIGLVTVLGLTIFVNYFAHRDAIRDAVWGGTSLENRMDVVKDAFTNLEVFDLYNGNHQIALDQRLNQNFFVGLAAQRIEEGQVNYLYGRSVWEALLALIPRALWPDKPVFGGSPKIVAEMTGLDLSPTTSWGVGQVMEFYINFGIFGLIGGFLLLGWGLGTLDRKAAAAEIRGDLGQAIVFFLPGAALVQPLGSMVELAGGAGAGLVAAYGWKWAWAQWAGQRLYAPVSDTRKSL